MKVGRPKIYETVEQLEEAVYDYFYPLVQSIEHESDCGTYVEHIPEDKQERQPRKKLSVNGLAIHLGFADKTTLYDYRDRPEFSHPIKWALTKIEQYHEEGLTESSVAGRIFALKNMGWKDKTEVEQSGNLSITWNEERTYEHK